MKLTDMKAKCRSCGRELIADQKDESFAIFYCMRCGIYTSVPLENFPEPAKPVPAPTPESGSAAMTKPQ
jgi:ribosomal protein S27AE